MLNLHNVTRCSFDPVGVALRATRRQSRRLFTAVSTLGLSRSMSTT